MLTDIIKDLCKENNIHYKDIVKYLCSKHKIYNYTINEEDNSINIISDNGGQVILKENCLAEIKINKIEGTFNFGFSRSAKLNNMPKEVTNFICSHNYLKSLEGMPKKVENAIFCRYNDIKDFKGIPEDFNGSLYCTGNPIEEVYKYFYNSKAIYWLNEFDVIQGDNIIMDRLEEVFHELDMPVPNIKEIKGYNLI